MSHQQSTLNEESIRPKNLLVSEDLLQQEERKEFMAMKHKFVSVPCPACGIEKSKPRFDKHGFDFVECTDCETVYVNPRPSSEMLDTYYSTSKSIKFMNDFIFAATDDVRRERIFRPRAEKVVEVCQLHGAKNKLLVDVGAGFGTFAEVIQENGHFDKVIAVEPSPDLANSCRKKNVEVLEKPIEKVELDNPSVITNFELIEHLFCPKDFIQACAGVLSQGGLMLLTTPNIKGFDLQVLGTLSNNIFAPNHLNYFHPASLSLLLERCGFEVLEVLTPGKLDAEIVRGRIQSGELDVSDSPFLRQVLIEEWDRVGQAFQDFIATNKLSSHMWIVARKK